MRKATYILLAVLCTALIAAMALAVIARFQRRSIVADSATPVYEMRILNTALVTYRSTYGILPASLAVLGPAPQGQARSGNAAGFIDAALASGKKSGYVFSYRRIDSQNRGVFDNYEIAAGPIDTMKSGQPYYWSDGTGVVRQELGRPATIQSQPDIQGK